jgi:excisionase family DNA binding protein
MSAVNPIDQHIELIAERVFEQRAAELAERLRAGNAPAEAAEFLSVKSASARFDIPEDTIRSWLKSGRLTRHKFGGCVRVKLSELLAMN